MHLPEVEAFISFALAQLSERNRHHDFEEIATRIARRRISANILLSNGPVSAGGDQQRDAESYTSRIPLELPFSEGFSASTSMSPVVLVCTVQKSDLKAKVLADLAGICAQNAGAVDHVVFFSVTSLPEAQTHLLQATARDAYGVTLDVISGAKVATLLAEPDLIWVAEYYLDLPASMVPPPDFDTTPEWYVQSRAAFRRNDDVSSLTPALQGEAAAGLRYATFNAAANADLPEWMDFMSAFLAPDVHPELQFRARYELSIALIRGTGQSEGVDRLIRLALDYALFSHRASILDDAGTLASYWGVAWVRGVSDVSAAEIASVRDQLAEHVEAQLALTDAQTHPVRAAALTGTLAGLAMQVRWERASVAPSRLAKRALDDLVGVRVDESAFDASMLGGQGLLNLDPVMTYLERLIQLLPVARAYSVRGVARLFAMFTSVLVDYPAYEKVRDGLDEALALVDGDRALAEKCRDRGVALFNSGKYLAALRELQLARTRWFHGESLLSSAVATRFIAELYQRLGLSYAAKMYALSAAALATQGDDDDIRALIPTAVLEGAGYAQAAGCLLDAAALTDIALAMHATYSPDPWNYEKHPGLVQHEGNDLLRLAAVKAYWPEYEALLAAAHTRTDWFDHLRSVLDDRENPIPFDEDEYQRLTQEQFTGPVFADLGPQRNIDFRALGVRWIFTFANDLDTVLSAEGFVASFQVLLAQVSIHDPVFIGATVRTTVQLSPGETFTIDVNDEEEDIEALALIPRQSSDLDELMRELVTAGIQLMGAVHVRPSGELIALLEPLVRDGTVGNLFVGRPYREVAHLLPSEHYERCAAHLMPAPSTSFAPAENEMLPASSRDGAGYDRAESLRRIRERYQTVYAWRLTLSQFLSDERGRAAFRRLREDGWLDWQILVTIVNVGYNWRMERYGLDPTAKSARRHATRTETHHDEQVPTDVILERLDAYTFVQMAAVAAVWNVRTRPESQGRRSLRGLLERRYHYASDDISHSDPLDSFDSDGSLLPFVFPPT